jgi:diaminopimelate epimerase
VGQALTSAAGLLPDLGPVALHRVDVDTPAGLRILYGLSIAGLVRFVTVDLGPPTLRRREFACTLEGDEVLDRPVHVAGRNFVITCVSTGNVHAVIFVPDVETVDVRHDGPALERASCFPDRANIHFVQVLNRTHLRMRNWERGAGETAACGTGACAATVAAHATGRAENSCLVTQPGGDVFIHLGETALLTGPTETMDEGIDAVSGCATKR